MPVLTTYEKDEPGSTVPTYRRWRYWAASVAKLAHITDVELNGIAFTGAPVYVLYEVISKMQRLGLDCFL